MSFQAYLDNIEEKTGKTPMEDTNLSPTTKFVSAVIVLVGILAQSGGFFLHLAIGQPGARSLGTTITSFGAALLVISILILVYGLITSK